MDKRINNLPNDYKIALYNAIKNAFICFENNLCNLTLGGSGGKNNIIEGWSDLDLYIILKEYNTKQIINFMNKLEKEKIHIGTTFYTTKELEKNMIDCKTKIMCYEKQNYNVNPTIYGKEVFKEISYEEVVENDIRNLPNVLHDFRRRYIELIRDNNNEIPKKYIKKLLVLVKCILNCNGIFTYGYTNTIEEFKKMLEKEGYDLTPIYDFDIMRTINNKDNDKEYIKQFSEFILKYIENGYKNKGEEKIWKKELVLEQ